MACSLSDSNFATIINMMHHFFKDGGSLQRRGRNEKLETPRTEATSGDDREAELLRHKACERRTVVIRKPTKFYSKDGPMRICDLSATFQEDQS